MIKTLPVLLLLLLLSCNNNRINKNDLSGIYVRSFQTEYAVGNDTLAFDKTADDTYRVRKASGYRRIKNGIISDQAEHHEAHWIGTFDKNYNVMQVLPSGKVITVDEKQNEILLGNNIYKRTDK